MSVALEDVSLHPRMYCQRKGARLLTHHNSRVAPKVQNVGKEFVR